MKKRTAMLLLSAILILVPACNTMTSGSGIGEIIREKRDMSGFNSIQLATIGNIILIQGDTESVEVETNENILPLIETKVENGILLISSLSKEGLQPSKEIIYYITARDLSSIYITRAGTVTAGDFVAKDLTISINGAGRVNFDSIKTTTLEIKIDGAGNFSTQRLEAETVNTNISGSGRCDFKGGSVQDQNISIPGSGTYFGEELESANTSVLIVKTAAVRVWATQTLIVEIQGTGTVFYKGDPVINSKIEGTGTLRQIQ